MQFPRVVILRIVFRELSLCAIFFRRASSPSCRLRSAKFHYFLNTHARICKYNNAAGNNEFLNNFMNNYIIIPLADIFAQLMSYRQKRYI